MITSIELKNWKAFDKLTLSFTNDINIITGPNGIGKSSILQALCVAFTGKIPDEGKNITFKDLVRNKSRDAQIIVELYYKDILYKIVRNFNYRSRRKSAIYRDDDFILFEGSWDEVTTQIISIFNVNSVFFDSIIYLSEGEVFRTLYSPRGKSLMENLDDLLGITKFRELTNEIDNLLKVYNKNESELKSDYEKLVEFSLSIDEDFKILDERLLINKEEETKYEKLKEMNIIKKVNILNNIKNLEEVIDIFNNINIKQEQIEERKDEYIDNKNNLKDIELELNNLTKNKQRTEIKIEEKGNIINLINISDIQNDRKPICPVCKKPLSKKELNTILVDSKGELLNLQTDLQNIRNNINAFMLEKNLLINKINSYENDKNIIDNLLIKVEPHKTSNQVKNELNELNNDYQVCLRNEIKYENILKNIKENIDEINQKITVKRTITKQDKQSIEVQLTANAKSQYVAEILKNGIDKYITLQRNSQLKNTLYQYISNVWDTFKQTSGWEMSLNNDGVPNLANQGINYSFAYLSGGEKTAILVITRTVLGKLISDEIGFLLLDEPLEHLDSKNRRSLLQFLVDAHKNRMVGQLIITTVEESLLTKFIEVEEVNLIPLENIIARI